MLLAAVSVPIGEYVDQIAAFVASIVIAGAASFIAYICRELPSWGVAFTKEYLTQQRVERAVNWAVTQIDHEMIDKATGKPRVVDITTGNNLTDLAIRYMEAYAPAVAAELGARLKPRILAQIAKIGVAPAQPMPNPLPAKPLPQISK